MKESIKDAVTTNNGTQEELSAFEWLTSDKRERVSNDAVKSFYYIGNFMLKLDKNHTQKESKDIRDSYFVGDGMTLSRNDYSACKQIAKKFDTLQAVKTAYKKTGTCSMGASRIWIALKGKPAEKSFNDKLQAKIKALGSNTGGAITLVDENVKDSMIKLSKLQQIEIALNEQLKAVRTAIKPLKESDSYNTMVAELAEQSDNYGVKIDKVA